MTFYERFEELCTNEGIKETTLLRNLGIGKNSAQNWKNGSSINSKTLEILADHFNVSIDYLLGRTDKQNQQIINNNSTVSGTQANSINSYGAEGIELDIINKMKLMTDTQKGELFLAACRLIEKE